MVIQAASNPVASMGFNGILGPCPSSKCLQACLAIILKTVLHAYDSFLVALQKLGVSRKV